MTGHGFMDARYVRVENCGQPPHQGQPGQSSWGLGISVWDFGSEAREHPHAKPIAPAPVAKRTAAKQKLLTHNPEPYDTSNHVGPLL